MFHAYKQCLMRRNKLIKSVVVKASVKASACRRCRGQNSLGPILPLRWQTGNYQAWQKSAKNEIGAYISSTEKAGVFLLRPIQRLHKHIVQ
jgi:hypothetical protein